MNFNDFSLLSLEESQMVLLKTRQLDRDSREFIFLK